MGLEILDFDSIGQEGLSQDRGRVDTKAGENHRKTK